ncbi:MAG: hypothetical protein IJY09_03330 [Lachnospiraceae bacterium]|nr:hypothetical protein [Lachnospiraceae bacterium]
MLDRNQFMEALLALADYAELNGNVLTKTEVEEAFSGMELQEGQYDMIYRYLFEKKIRIQGISLQAGMEQNCQETVQAWQEEAKDIGDEADALEAENTEQSMEAADSVYLKMYLEELAELPDCTEEQRVELVMRLLAGEDWVMSELLNATLHQVVELARGYQGRGALLEDLIQEGNIGLWNALEQLNGKKRQEEPLLFLKESIQFAMEQYIDSLMQADDSEEQVVAKLALLHEAAKAMAKENGELPTAKELAEYAHLSEEEVRAMARISKEVDFIKPSEL